MRTHFLLKRAHILKTTRGWLEEAKASDTRGHYDALKQQVDALKVELRKLGPSPCDAYEEAEAPPPPPPASASASNSASTLVKPKSKNAAEGKHIKKLAKRKLIINELIHTERTYVQNLKVICEVFLEPLEQLLGTRKAILTKEEMC